ncbi:MAG: wax ester/triacylglycerol synthase family O-acyltransferase [Solirubrobacteraceae bacterium]|jgi:WS/DGAT/MGAT family acyltransferase
MRTPLGESMQATDTAHHQLSGADTAWLHMDRPTNLMVINSLMLFEERLAWGRLREVMRWRLVGPYPRFRQLAVEGRLGLSGPFFEDDPQFDLDRHLHHLGLPEPGDEAALRELVGDLIATPLDHAKPLWDIYLLDRPAGGQALLLRVHHCIGDGLALAQVVLSLTDATPAEAAPPRGREQQSRRRGGMGGALGRAIGVPVAGVAGPAAAAIGTTRRLVSGVALGGMNLLVHPRQARDLADGAAADVRALLKLLFTPADAETALRGELAPARRVAWTGQLDLAMVKATAHAQGATVNDVLLAAVSGALRRHLRAGGEEPREIRALVPFNLRPAQEPIPRELGNRFGLVYLTLPVDVAGGRARLQELKRRMSAIKGSPEGPISYALLQAIGLVPEQLERRIVDMITAKASAVMTNVPGPREVMYLAGRPVRAVLVWAPTSGSVGMSVSIFSYCEEVTIGLLVDAGLVAEPQAIIRRLEQELAALARLKPLVGPSVDGAAKAGRRR